MPPTRQGTDFSLIHAHSKSIISGVIRAYGDWWETRGAQYALLDGLHKYILGWLDASQIEITTSGGNFWIDQRELSFQRNKTCGSSVMEQGRMVLQLLSILNTTGDLESLILNSPFPTGTP